MIRLNRDGLHYWRITKSLWISSWLTLICSQSPKLSLKECNTLLKMFTHTKILLLRLMHWQDYQDTHLINYSLLISCMNSQLSRHALEFLSVTLMVKYFMGETLILKCGIFFQTYWFTYNITKEERKYSTQTSLLEVSSHWQDQSQEHLLLMLIQDKQRVLKMTWLVY